MAMKASLYELGSGGKSRKRPSRKPMTPYDRPPLFHPLSQEKKNGWLSRIIDPASKIIVRSGSSFFASMFQKRLTDMKPDPVHKVHIEEVENPLGCMNKEFDGHEESSIENSLSSSLHELEQMLKGKTLSSDELNRLTKILQARIVDPCNNDKSEKIQFNSSKKSVTCVAEEDKSSTMQRDVRSQAVDKETASPAEVAKAFMGSRVTRMMPGSSALPGHTFAKFASITPRTRSFSVKPIIQSCCESEEKVDCFFIPQSQGGRIIPHPPASAYSRFASDSCFEKTDNYIGKSESKWADDAPSSSRKALKRRNSFFDNDIGPISSIRRIRHKSNLMPAFKGLALPAESPLFPSSDAVHRFLPSSQKHVQLHLLEYRFPANSLVANGDNKNVPANVASVPCQSSERARKILEELDRTIPPSKEKSPELKLAISRDESPAMLTCNVLDGKALRSMEDEDLTKFSNRHSIILGGSSTTYKLNHNESKDKFEEPEPMGETINAITSQYGGLTKQSTSFPGALPGTMNGDSGSLSHSRERLPFQMIAPEMDEDNYSVEEVSTKSLAQKEKETAIDTSVQKSLMHPPGEKPSRSPSLITPISVDHVSNLDMTPRLMRSISESLPVPAFPSPMYGNGIEIKGVAGEKVSLVPLGTPDSSALNCPSKTISAGTEAEASENAVLKMGTSIQQRTSEQDNESELRKDEGTAMSSAFASASLPTSHSGFETLSAPPNNGLENSTFSSRALFPQVVSVPPFASRSITTSYPISSEGSVGLQFGADNSSSPLATNLISSFSKPQLTSKVLGNPSHVDDSGSPPVTLPVQSALVSATASRPMDSGSSIACEKSKIPDFLFGSANSSSCLGSNSQIIGSGSGNASLTSHSSSCSSLSALSPAPCLPAVSTSGAVSSPLGSFVAPPQIRSPVTTTASIVPDMQTSAPSSDFGNPIGTESAFLFSSGLSSSLSGTSGFSFGPSNSDATAATSLFSSRGSTAGAASKNAEFSFGGSSANPTSPSNTGIFIGAAASSTMPALSTGFSFGGSSVGTSTASSSLLSSGASLGAFTSSSSTAGFSFGVSPFCVNAASSSSTTGFSFGLASATPFSFGGSSVISNSSSSGTSVSSGPAASASATSFSFGLSSGASSSSIAGFSFVAGTPSAATTAAFSFGASSSSNSVPFSFGVSPGTSASVGSSFPFTASTSSTATSMGFTSSPGSSFPAQAKVMFGSVSPVNDQMNVEDSMAEDVSQASAPIIPAFAMSSSQSSNFTFGSPNVPTVGPHAFSFGAPQALLSPQVPAPFPAGGSLEFGGGSFSLGTNGGDKSGRKIVRVKRDKVRKK